MFGALYFFIMVLETFSQSVIPGILQKLIFKQENGSSVEFPMQKDEESENVSIVDADQGTSKKTDKKKVKRRRRRDRKKSEESTDDYNHHKRGGNASEDVMESEEEFLDMNSAFVSLAVSRKKLCNPCLSNEAAQSRAKEKSAKICDDEVDSKCIAASERLAIQGCKLAAKELHERAIEVFTKAIELTPDDCRFYGNRSFCYCQLGHHKRALKDADKAVSLAPENAKGFFRKGEALRALKKFEEAKTAFEQVLKLDKDCEDARAELRTVEQEQFLETASKDSFHHSLNSSFDCSQSSGGSLSSGGNSLHGDLAHSCRIDSKMDPTNPDGSCSLWIGNISLAVTEQQLFDIFSVYGLVLSVRILPKKFCAFVNFQNAASAGMAMKSMQRTLLGGERILIRFPDKTALTPQKFYPMNSSSASSAPMNSCMKPFPNYQSRGVMGRNWNTK